MDSVILNKKQLKTARYLANAIFGRGTYYKRDGSADTKVRNYVNEDGIGVLWTETPSGSDFTVTVEFASRETTYGSDGEYDKLLTLLGFDSGMKNALRDGDYEAQHDAESKLHQDIVDAVEAAIEAPAYLIPPAGEHEAAVETLDVCLAPSVSVHEVQMEIHLDEAKGKDQTVFATHTINPRAKRDKCATMRLAKEYGLPEETEFAKIVEQFGNDAVTRYQDLLRLVPSFGLTEADVRHAFPHEYAMLPL